MNVCNKIETDSQVQRRHEWLPVQRGKTGEARQEYGIKKHKPLWLQ